MEDDVIVKVSEQTVGQPQWISDHDTGARFPLRTVSYGLHGRGIRPIEIGHLVLPALPAKALRFGLVVGKKLFNSIDIPFSNRRRNRDRSEQQSQQTEERHGENPPLGSMSRLYRVN
jgi:hypothetical protein